MASPSVSGANWSPTCAANGGASSSSPGREPRGGSTLAVLVVTGPSGVGKGTLIRALRERIPRLALSTSATTRAPRPGEVDGRDYHFMTPAQFDEHVRNGDFLEHAHYAGNHYGTLRSELARARDGGLVLEIELEGARQVRRAFPDAVQVFVMPPTEQALRARLESRGTDSPEQIEGRLARAKEELAASSEFRHVIVNDDLDRAVDALAEVAATIDIGISPTSGGDSMPPPQGAPE